MGRKPFPQPWKRKKSGIWYLELNGSQINLGRDRAQAFQTYHELMAKHRPDALAATGESPLVGTIFQKFLAWVQANRAQGTWESYCKRLQSFVDWMPDQRLSVAALKPHHVQEWADSHSTWAPGMKRGRIMAVQTAMNWAAENGHIERSPIAKIRKPAQGRRENVVSPEDWVTLMRLVKTPTLRDLLDMAWETGARPQELVRVAKRDVDFDGKRWVFAIINSKGKKRIRVVHLTDLAVALCKRLALARPEGPLLLNAHGRPWTAYAASNALERLAVKFGRKVAMVDIRHSFATRLLKAGVDPITVAALMGHTDPSMLAKVYSHVHQDAQHLRDALNRAAGT